MLTVPALTHSYLPLYQEDMHTPWYKVQYVFHQHIYTAVGSFNIYPHPLPPPRLLLIDNRVLLVMIIIHSFTHSRQLVCHAISKKATQSPYFIVEVVKLSSKSWTTAMPQLLALFTQILTVGQTTLIIVIIWVWPVFEEKSVSFVS